MFIMCLLPSRLLKILIFTLLQVSALIMEQKSLQRSFNDSKQKLLQLVACQSRKIKNLEKKSTCMYDQNLTTLFANIVCNSSDVDAYISNFLHRVLNDSVCIALCAGCEDRKNYISLLR